MTDSFFGFDTSLPVKDDGGGGIGDELEDSEEEYDALNEETFGRAQEEDWEEQHEDLVRLDQREGGDGDSGPDSDLDMNFSALRIDNLELDDDNESEARLQLDPSVWTMPSKPETPRPSHHHPHHSQQQHHQLPMIPGPGPSLMHRPSLPGPPLMGLPSGFPLPNPTQMRICSVEEIEQNMMKQQAQQKQQQQQHQQGQLRLPPPPRHLPPPPQDNGANLAGLGRPPPGFLSPAMMSQPPPAIPVGFPPPPLGMGPPPPLHLLQTNVPPPLFPLNVPPPNFGGDANHANFNQRLVQEIQQNHPMLNRQGQYGQGNRYGGHNNRGQQQQGGYHQQQQQRDQINRHMNGKFNRSGEYDEYANLMSERDKQWLLGIQLSQLNKETPYYNDYYFCVFRDRKERQKGEIESKAHKDNTFYHPFSQQMMQRNGLIGRGERRNSEKSQEIKEVPARNYTPLQFENSLGKLQCGSVTAPRKIIDQDVVAETTANSGLAVSSEVLSQRKSRQILLHVENLYKITLKLEDLSNPLAIEAKQQLKEKKERERLLALERNQQVDDQNNLTANGTDVDSEDNFDNLLTKLCAGLTPEGVLLILAVRKGKILLKRIQAVLKDHTFRWNLWCTVLSSLALLPKRERDDPEELLSPLFLQLENHLKFSTSSELLPLVETFLNSDKLFHQVPQCRFLFTTVLTLIDRMEHYQNGASNNPTTEMLERWNLFLNELSRSISAQQTPNNTGGARKILLKLDADCKILNTLKDHFRRHPTLDLDLKLLSLISIVGEGNGAGDKL
ncbi:protein PAT1 homolog 1-like [Uranotaenia lowii]|uniref:protein PAT1 homolog 1-like n=1 Tax=Uranotaenia lowii TaxID=190385 RepID=UPI0024792A9E|nr:protein PAT1 homolog 1-like [Uranotaenia lowii]